MKAIAIDGPAGAGKSTLSKKLAKELGFVYVDTGALYRTVGISLINAQISINNIKKITQHLKKTTVDIKYIKGEQRVLLNGVDVSDEIRTPQASMMASDCSALPEVRKFLLELQRKLAREHDVVMDGRDIATVVLPNADVKIFLTADPEERARRRYEELLQKGTKVSFDEVLQDLKKRDYNDSHRKIAPLKPAEDSIIVNTTGNTLEKSISVLKEIVIKSL